MREKILRVQGSNSFEPVPGENNLREITIAKKETVTHDCLNNPIFGQFQKKPGFAMIASIALAVLITGCAKDTDGPVDGSGAKTGKATTVQFSIQQTAPSVYSAEDNTEAPVTGESEITDVEIYVFNDAGYFESQISSPVTASGQDFLTEEFTITTGTKFFYILGNVPTGITLPTAGELTPTYHRSAFETIIQTLDVADITTSGDFFIATRWGASTEVAGTGTEGSPEQISQSVGRMSAKITIQLAETVTSSLSGTFSQQESRVINVPTNMYLIGQWTGSPLTPGAQVTTPHFLTYDIATDFHPAEDVWQDMSPTATIESVYTIENTNEVPRNETATSVQVRMTYTPSASELLQADGSPGGTLDASGTFWLGEYSDGRIFIYDSTPTDPDVVNSLEFTNGVCYYIVPVADVSESVPSAKYSVIRNHSYRLTITAINTLGNNTPDIPDPTDPIEIPADVQVLITVVDWSLIEQNVGL